MTCAEGPVYGTSPGEHLVQHAGERVEIAPGIRRLAAGLLRRHVLRRADHEAHPGKFFAAGLGRPGDPEVGDARVALHQEDVLRLDVAVDHVPGVGVVQGVGDPPRDAHRVPHRQAALPPEPVAERPGLDVGHGVPEPAVIVAGVVDRQDVGVVEPGGEPDLAEEALRGYGGGKLRVHELEHDRPGVPEVLHQVHRRHAAPAELALEAVAGGEGDPETIEIGGQRIRRRLMFQG